MVLFMGDLSTISFASTQLVCCFVPPLALQIGSGSFLLSYKSKDGLSLSSISGIMVSGMSLYQSIFQSHAIFLVLDR